MASTVPKAKAGVDVYRSEASIADLFGDITGRALLEAIWTTYQATRSHTHTDNTLFFVSMFLHSLLF